MGNRGFLEALPEQDIEVGDAFIEQARKQADTPQTRLRQPVLDAGQGHCGTGAR